jgi:sigma-B regulation protein RsbU (phosphoserine phosphatase)
LQSPVGRTLQMGQGIIGRAARTATVQYVADVSEDRDFVPILPTIVAEAAMPILLDERVWGVLNVETADQETLTLTDVPLLGMFCQQISVAIRNAGYFADQAAAAQENARLYQLEAKRRQLADTLRQLASAVSSMIDF